MERDGDLRPPATTAPDQAQAALDEAIQTRRAIHDELFAATNAFRDALAARDERAMVVTYARAHLLDQQWYEAAARADDLAERLRQMRRPHHDAWEAAA